MRKVQTCSGSPAATTGDGPEWYAVSMHWSPKHTDCFQTYHPDDIKGKGEPYFTIDKALKEHKKYGDSGTELRSRRRNVSLGTADVPNSFPAESFEGGNAGVGRSNTTGKSMGSALKKRFGSLRRRNVEA